MDRHIPRFSFDRKLDTFKACKYAKTFARICILIDALGSSMIVLQMTARFSAGRSIASWMVAKKKDTKKSHRSSIVT